MRFDPTPNNEETVVVRIRIPIALRARYQTVAEEKHMDVMALYAQALAFAAEDDPAANAAKTRKRRSMPSTVTGKI